MPRYHFHVHDGIDVQDDEGTELAGLGEARRHAVRYAAALLLEIGDSFWAGDGWSMDVVDDAGLCQFTLHFLATDASSAMDPARTLADA